MYYVITLKGGLITGRHHSTVPITAETFSASSVFAGHTVQEIDPRTEYTAGFQLAEYTADGMLRPLVERINEGLAKVPEGYELIDGELVQTQVPEADAPPTLMARVVAAEEAAVNSRAEEAKAARVLFRALAQSDVITPEQALDNRTMFAHWAERIGKTATTGEYLRYEDGLYRVQQGHVIQEHQPLGVATAALYTRIQSPGAVQAWVTGQSYAKDVQVTHGGKTWLSMVDNNTWEPGASGVGENIWKRVRDA